MRIFNIYYNQYKLGSKIIIEQCQKHQAKNKATVAMERNGHIVTVATACLNPKVDKDNNHIANSIATGRYYSSNYMPMHMNYDGKKYNVLRFEGYDQDPLYMGKNIETVHTKLTHAILYNIALKRFSRSRNQYPDMTNVLENSTIQIASKK